MTSVFLFWERPSSSWRGSKLYWAGAWSGRGPAHNQYCKALEARRARKPKMVLSSLKIMALLATQPSIVDKPQRMVSFSPRK